MQKTTPTQRPAIDERTLRRLSVEADCDPRTVLSVYLGLGTRRADSRERARKALVAAGFLS